MSVKVQEAFLEEVTFEPNLEGKADSLAGREVKSFQQRKRSTWRSTGEKEATALLWPPPC